MKRKVISSHIYFIRTVFFFAIAYPKVNEKTNANVSLHCKGVHMLVIKHNPGIYVIEQSDSDDSWGAATVVNTFSDFLMRKEYANTIIYYDLQLLATRKSPGTKNVHMEPMQV